MITLKSKNMNFINIKAVSINDIHIHKTVVSGKFPFGKQDFRYFIFYKENTKMRSLCIFLPEISLCKRYLDKTKCMCFMIKVDKFFDKCVKIWETVSNIIIKLIVNL